MSNFNRPQHQYIAQILDCFNQDFLQQNNILFGGGTRIAMELDEYRESIDVDFFCSGFGSYRAARSEVTQSSLGNLLMNNTSLTLMREVRADRDAVRTFVAMQNNNPVKLELINFDLTIAAESNQLFSVPIVSKEYCFITKLLANADRYMQGEHKDIFDLCMMWQHWGGIPDTATQKANEVYGEKVVLNGLKKALAYFIDTPSAMENVAVSNLKIDSALAKEIIYQIAPNFMQSLAEDCRGGL